MILTRKQFIDYVDSDLRSRVPVVVDLDSTGSMRLSISSFGISANVVFLGTTRGEIATFKTSKALHKFLKSNFDLYRVDISLSFR